MTGIYKLNVKEAVKAIREHAINNYHQGGWDVVVESYSDLDIAFILGQTSTDHTGFVTTDQAIEFVSANLEKDLQLTEY